MVADIGAGDGRFSVAVARRVGPEGHVYATEIDPESLERIRESVREAGLENVTVLAAGPDLKLLLAPGIPLYYFLRRLRG